MFRLRRSFPLFLAIAIITVVSGCHHSAQNASPPVANLPVAPKPVGVTNSPAMLAQLAAAKVNETGEVPIFEYHELVDDNVTPHAYQYRKSAFRADMERMYADGYRPINLTELVTGHINCPIGYSPFVITFDDALRGQIDFLPNGQIDPTCAIGILQSMHRQHPDWRLAATFFVLPARGQSDYFYQSKYSRAKLNWLVNNGFELGNHTVHHAKGIRSWPDSKVESEFAVAAKMIDDNVPGYKVDLLALPFGVYPKKISLVQSGSYNGLTYQNICALRAGAAPAVSPVTKEWNPFRIQRIIPGTGPMTIGYWLDYLDRHKDKRYVSDGDPATITVPQQLASDVDSNQLKTLGLTLRTYGAPETVSKATDAVKSKTHTT